MLSLSFMTIESLLRLRPRCSYSAVAGSADPRLLVEPGLDSWLLFLRSLETCDLVLQFSARSARLERRVEGSEEAIVTVSRECLGSLGAIGRDGAAIAAAVAA
jgi:hypothetical protein